MLWFKSALVVFLLPSISDLFSSLQLTTKRILVKPVLTRDHIKEVAKVPKCIYLNVRQNGYQYRDEVICFFIELCTVQFRE